MEEPEIPSIAEWFNKLRFIGLMSKLSTICSNKAGQNTALVKFTKQWEWFL